MAGQGLSTEFGDTIFALATAPGRAGVAIIRISGPVAAEVLEKIAGNIPAPRVMSLRALRAINSSLPRAERDMIDRGLVVRFEQNASYTGEEMCELHVHGGQATVARLLAEIGLLPGLRVAEPGEFTRRALSNGSMDLTQVEGLGDLIDAETESQRVQALALTEGALSETVNIWRQRLLEAIALLEATIDFADEEDAPTDVSEMIGDILQPLEQELEDVLCGAVFASQVRTGFTVALVGPPNAGKSSLINAISGEDIAITSPVAGTTRDVIRAAVNLGGQKVVFVDMAGIRGTRDCVESIGVDRALAQAASADLRVFLSSIDTDAGEAAIQRLKQKGDITIWAKADLGTGDADLEISVLKNSGVKEFLDLVGAQLSGRSEGSSLVARERQAQKLRQALLEVRKSGNTSAGEISAYHLRRAMIALGGIVHPIGAEDILGEIFSRFCIGK